MLNVRSQNIPSNYSVLKINILKKWMHYDYVIYITIVAKYLSEKNIIILSQVLKLKKKIGTKIYIFYFYKLKIFHIFSCFCTLYSLELFKNYAK